MTETIYLPDTDGGEGPETWPAPKHWRVCAQGHLVTDKINSYKVQRGNGVTTFACKSWALTRRPSRLLCAQPSGIRRQKNTCT